MDSSYRQEQLGLGRVRFTVTAAKVPGASGAPLALAGLFALAVLATITRDMGALGLLVRGAIGFFGARLVYTATNRWFTASVDRRRKPGGTFVVAPGRIEPASGPAITREELHRLLVRNAVTEGAEVAIVNRGTVLSGLQAGAQNDRSANRAKAAGVSYMLCAEYGGRSVTLAGGMTEVTAHGLITDVSRLLGARDEGTPHAPVRAAERPGARPGAHAVPLALAALAPGVYLARLDAGLARSTAKPVITR